MTYHYDESPDVLTWGTWKAGKNGILRWVPHPVAAVAPTKPRKRKPRPPRTITCAHCGGTFTATGTGNPKYCTDEHRKEAIRLQKRELWLRKKAERQRAKDAA